MKTMKGEMAKRTFAGVQRPIVICPLMSITLPISYISIAYPFRNVYLYFLIYSLLFIPYSFPNVYSISIF